MTIDLAELKRLAHEARSEPWRGFDSDEGYEIRSANWDVAIRIDGIRAFEAMHFMLEANPSTILDLVVELELLRDLTKESPDIVNVLSAHKKVIDRTISEIEDLRSKVEFYQGDDT